MARKAKRKSTWYDAFLDVGIWILFALLLLPAGAVGYVIGKDQASDEPATTEQAQAGEGADGQTGIESAPAFSADDLTAEPEDAWLTNGGTLDEPALLAARRDRHRQRQGPQGRLDDRPQGLRCRRQVLGRGPADRLRGDDVHPDRRRRRLRGRRGQRQDPLGVPGAPGADDQHGLLRLALARRRARRRQGLHRPAGREARRARPEDRQGRLGDGRRALAGRFHADARAALLRRHGDRGRLRRRVLASRPRHCLRRQDGQAEVAILDDPRPR